MPKRANKETDTRSSYERLAKLGKAAFTSQSALTNLLKDVKSNGVPVAFSRATQHRARSELCDTRTEYGPLVTQLTLQVTEKGKVQDVVVGFQNPLAFFNYHCEHSPHYAKIVDDALKIHPCSPSNPWDIILYQDGVDPSDGLAKNKSRKSAVFYWSFKQFGYEALAHEQVWGTVTLMRAHKAVKLDGGMTQLTHRALEQFFGDVHDIRRSGVSFKLHATQERAKVFAKIGIMLADMPAISEMLACKGHGGTKCCPKCRNATHHKPPGGADPLHVHSDFAVPITDTDISKFKQYSNRQMKTAVRKINEYKDKLRNGDIKPDEFDSIEQVYGWTYNPWSILLNSKFLLDGADCIMYDWAHVYVANGIGDSEFGDFMHVMNKCKTRAGDPADCTYANLYEYMKQWLWPKGKGNPLHLLGDVHDHKRYLTNKDFPCTSSEFITLTPVLKRYLKRVTRRSGASPTHVESMIACLEVIEMLMSVNRNAVTPEKLHAAICKHLELYKIAYGEDAFRPKHHYALHLSGMLEFHKMLLSTFTHERKHRSFKRYCRGRNILKSFELNIIKDITVHSMWELELPFYRAFSTAEPRGDQKMLLAELFAHHGDCKLTVHNEITINGGGCSPGDCVSFMHEGRENVGQLLLTVGVAGQTTPNAVGDMYCYVAKWELRAVGADPSIRTYDVVDCTVMVHEQCLDTVFVHAYSPDRKTCTILLPYECL